MGIDVGNALHYEIDEWLIPATRIAAIDINQASKCRVLRADAVYGQDAFGVVAQLMDDFRVNFAVIDAQPERRMALSFANSRYGRIKLCSYEQGIEGKSIHVAADEPRLRVDRTSWLDLSLGRFKSGTIRFPADVHPDYGDHIKAQVAITKKDRNGNPTRAYITPSGQDHFGHARNYAEIALPLACAIATNEDIPGAIF
jgi:hypothetical protein